MRHSNAKRKTLQRELRATLRDTFLLVKEFQIPLALFVLTTIGSGVLYYELARPTTHALSGIAESIYLALCMIFLQPFIDFPRIWYLQIFFFLLPVIGISLLALGLTDFGILFFNRRSRSKEWEMAVASTFKDHVILVGLGHLGYRVALSLHEMEEDVVVIDSKPKPDLLNSIRELGIPVIEDDASRDSVILNAGIRSARSIVICVQNDSLNLQIALKARSLNPNVDVIIRIFEEDFAQALQKQFGYKAFSATSMAAPAFAAYAARIDVTPPITIGGQINSLARMNIEGSSPLVGRTIEEIETEYHISIVSLCRETINENHPSGRIEVMSGDSIAILGNPEQINMFIDDNRE